MNIKYPIARHNLQTTLLVLSDMDYQTEVWVNMDRQKIAEYVGFQIEAENLLDNVIWDEGEGLIGFVFRSKSELDAAYHVVECFKKLLDTMGEGLDDKTYITSPLWLPVVAAARNALRIMNAGDK